MEALWFLPLILSCIVIISINIIRSPRKVALHLLSLVFLITYGLSGWYSWFNYIEDSHIYSNFVRDTQTYIYSAILILISYFLALLGYKFSYCLRLRQKKTKFELRYILIASNISFVLMLLFMMVYVFQYGGLGNALNSAAAIRSGYGELETTGRLTFTKYLMPIGVFPFLTYAYLIFVEKNRVFFIPFIVITPLIFLAFILMSGRTRILTYIIVLILMLLMSTKNSFSFTKFFAFTPLVFLGVIFIMYGKKIFSSIESINNGESIINVISSSEDQASFFESFVGYFGHRVYSVEIALNDFTNNNGNLLFFKDSFYLPLYFIPERLTGIVKPDSISFYNTQQLTGIYESMAPPGILAYGLYSLWIPGMFIMSFLYGSGFGYLDRLMNDNNNDNKIIIILLPLLLAWALYGSTGDTRIVINGVIYILLYVLILFSIKIFYYFNNP